MYKVALSPMIALFFDAGFYGLIFFQILILWQGVQLFCWIEFILYFWLELRFIELEWFLKCLMHQKEIESYQIWIFSLVERFDVIA